MYLPLYVGKIPKETAEIERHSSYLTINDRPVPIGIIKTCVREYNIYTVNLSDKALLDLAEKLAEQKLVGEFGRENIESKQINVTLNFNSAEARCNAQVLENIGEEVRLFSKKTKINS